MGIARRILAGVRRLGFDYHCFRVMRFALDERVPEARTPAGLAFESVDEATVAASADAVIRESHFYAGDEALGFALRRDGRIVCLQWFWHGERARRSAFWPLGPREAVSMHLVTVPDERGRGHATTLKRLTAPRLRDEGFDALYSRIWWTNVPSLRVSEKAGWQRVGTTLDVALPGRATPLAWRFGRRGAAASAGRSGAATPHARGARS